MLTPSTVLLRILDNKICRFIFSGLINTVFGFSIYSVLIYIELPYLLALLISTILGVFFNFFSFGHIVFGKHWNLLVLSKFIVSYVISYLFNSGMLIILTKNLLFDPYLGQLLCILPSAFICWFLLNHWVYK